MKTVKLRELLLAQQAELVAGVDTARGVVEHPTDLGMIVEIDWCAAFRRFLPERYAVNKATIVDADGKRSDALDLVVHDTTHSPLLFEKSGVRYIPAESVYAVFEIRQELNRANVRYAAEKAESARGLRRTSAPFLNAGGDVRPLKLFPIVAGILATSSSWTDPLGPRLREALGECSRDGQLDLGCALHHGGFAAAYPKDGAVAIERSASDAGLIFILMYLFEQLRLMGTVPAIDLQEWGRTLEPDT
ncbi:MAG TPA: DUF6602 domain-containing protein [Gaiellaceae bacterium]|nr:DUF6602 domain-containing protein [Gaiellaceae bacterium]